MYCIYIKGRYTINLFYLSKYPTKNAQYHNDKHVVKMITELVQQLSTAHRVLDGIEYIDYSRNNRRIRRFYLLDGKMNQALYKATHINHPMNIWVRESNAHYDYTYALARALAREYSYRYNKNHKSANVLPYLSEPPKCLLNNKWRDPPQSMPKDVQNEDTVVAYRNYYMLYKYHIASWKYRKVPYWWKGEQ